MPSSPKINGSIAPPTIRYGRARPTPRTHFSRSSSSGTTRGAIAVKDVNAIQTSSGLSFPFQREHGGTGLGMWTVQVQPRPRLACGPQNEAPPVGEHASTSTATAHPPDKRTPNPRWALSFRDEIHSSRASSVLAALDTNKPAQLLHQRLHIGTHLIRALPTLTADAPSKLAQASPSACPHWVAANATRLPHRGERYRESTPGRLFFADMLPFHQRLRSDSATCSFWWMTTVGSNLHGDSGPSHHRSIRSDGTITRTPTPASPT